MLLIALVGGLLVWQTSREQGRLLAKIERLTRTTGDLSITDPSKIHVVALHFAWRIYLPANYELVERKTPAEPVSASPTSPQPSREMIMRVRFREDAEGRLNLYQTFENYTTRGTFGDKSLSEVLHGRFDKVVVEQLGTHAVVSIGVNEPLDLLRLKLPADMEAAIVKARERSPDKRAGYDNPEFFNLCFGPEAKKPPPGEREEVTP